MVNYILNEDSLTLSLFSPTGEYSMITSDNKKFFQIVNMVKKPETEWKDIEDFISNKIFNFSLGYIELIERDGNLYYKIAGCEEKSLPEKLFKLICENAEFSYRDLYFTSVLDFLSQHENQIQYLDCSQIVGISVNGNLVAFDSDDYTNRKYVELDEIKDAEDLKKYPKSGVVFRLINVKNINEKKDLSVIGVTDFLKNFWKTDKYKELKKLSINNSIRDKFINRVSAEFGIFDFDLLNYSLDFMNDEWGLYNLLLLI